MSATFWTVLVLLVVVIVQAVCVDRLVRICRRQSREVAKLAHAVGEQSETVAQLADRLAR